MSAKARGSCCAVGASQSVGGSASPHALGQGNTRCLHHGAAQQQRTVLGHGSQRQPAASARDATNAGNARRPTAVVAGGAVPCLFVCSMLLREFPCCSCISCTSSSKLARRVHMAVGDGGIRVIHVTSLHPYTAAPCAGVSFVSPCRSSHGGATFHA
jgi:hypothetical protein